MSHSFGQGPRVKREELTPPPSRLLAAGKRVLELPVLTPPPSVRPRLHRPSPVAAISSFNTNFNHTYNYHGSDPPPPLSSRRSQATSTYTPSVNNQDVFGQISSNALGLFQTAPPHHAPINSLHNGFLPPSYNDSSFSTAQHGSSQLPLQIPNQQFPQYSVPLSASTDTPIQTFASSYYNILSQPNVAMPADTNMDRFNDSLMPILASFEANRLAQSSELTLEDLLADDAFMSGAAVGDGVDLAKAAQHLRSFAETHSAASFDFTSSRSDEPRAPLSPLSSLSTTAIDPGFPPLIAAETGSLSPAVNPLHLSGSSAETSDDALASILDSLFGTFAATATEPTPTPSFILPPLPELLSTASAARASESPRPKKPLPSRSTPKSTPKPRDLLPLDAPIQPRQYVAPSKTSRKVLPQAFVNRISEDKVAGVKRVLASVEPEPAIDPEAVDLARFVKPKIEIKREQNTMAARRSRQRKAAEKAALEEELEAARAELAETKRQLEDARAENRILREVMAKRT